MQKKSEISNFSPKIEKVSFNEKYRYCTECLIDGTSIDKTKLKKKLSELGDSIVVAGRSTKLKIHIHSDHPKNVINMNK